mmetsp:Transcript_4228/g.8230  ORF Transcript_4228/g.8230 Transcript_4228/m.8230 type:complete len:195 (-) Transcript_4228:415-999(-)|eukprot:CAMPEP_0184678794 /NCGR_PEP_ID=MMETSP0312-20130426/1583_1 /TAXON_ID=31354 /ORGANISM="Compsopogon coeruleus, Strain SAG 36.94" /LENGTH=194 /DNA_ID=CAMNT_0027127799 /DNA_START=84 /DNA_END=668 /DNA_ORIENTATION=-
MDCGFVAGSLPVVSRGTNRSSICPIVTAPKGLNVQCVGGMRPHSNLARRRLDPMLSPMMGFPFGSLMQEFADAMEKETTWIPRGDFHETEKEYFLRLEIPGFPKEKVSASIEDGVLTITGDMNRNGKDAADNTEKDVEDPRPIESFYTKFTRSWRLPKNVKKESIRAEARDGILTVVIPKLAPEEPTIIPITVN